jgi:hypothetical protein
MNEACADAIGCGMIVGRSCKLVVVGGLGCGINMIVLAGDALGVLVYIQLIQACGPSLSIQQ